ncbi:MAG: hypothetical protein RL238_230 [Actinomycetota bacterium]|jgi:hypothetical protein
MVEDELRNELRGAGLEPSAEFRARMGHDFEDALAGRRVLGVTPSPVQHRRTGWLWPAIGAAAAVLAVAVVVTRGDDHDVVTPVSTTVVPSTTTAPPTTLPAEVAMEVLTGTLFGLELGDVVDVEATIARIDALGFGPHTFDSGWYLVPDDPSIDSCYDDSEYRGVMWGDVAIIFNGTDDAAEVMRWTVGDASSTDSGFFLGEPFPTPERANGIVSVEGISIGSAADALQPPEFDAPIDRGDGTVGHSVADIGPEDGSLPQPFVIVYSTDGEVTSILADTGRC